MTRSLVLNVLCLGGLAALGIGLWWERPSLTLIVVGAIVCHWSARRI